MQGPRRRGVRAFARSAIPGAVAWGLAWGCAEPPLFLCSDDEACGVDGVCEAQGFCSFPDPGCASGRRFGTHAPPVLAAQCVPVMAASSTSGVAGSESGAADSGPAAASSSDGVAPGTDTVAPATGSGTDGPTPPADWWDPAWSRRRTVQVTAGSAQRALPDFVVPLALADVVDPTTTRAQGQDIRVVMTAAAGRRVLPHETVGWTAEQAGVVWVRLPSLPPVGQTLELELYYGNPAARDAAQPAAVWSAYEAVWHGDGDGTDAGPAALDLELAAVSFEAGVVGGAMRFSQDEGSSARAGSPASLDALFADGACASVWLNPEGYGGGGFGRVFDRSVGINGQRGYSLYVSMSLPDGLVFQHGAETTDDGFWRYDLASGAVPQDGWHFATVCHRTDGSLPTIFVDGEAHQSVETSAALEGAAPASGADVEFSIGERSGASDRTFDGRIDELHVMRGMVDLTWHVEAYRAALGQAATIGRAQTLD